MRKQEAFTYKSDWEYREAQKQERKQDRQRRKERRSKSSRWSPRGADE